MCGEGSEAVRAGYVKIPTVFLTCSRYLLIHNSVFLPVSYASFLLQMHWHKRTVKECVRHQLSKVWLFLGYTWIFDQPKGCWHYGQWTFEKCPSLLGYEILNPGNVPNSHLEDLLEFKIIVRWNSPNQEVLVGNTHHHLPQKHLKWN